MRRMIAPLALLAATTLIAAAPAAMAGDRDGDDGWDRPACACDCGCEHAEEVRLPDSFFYDDGGVGPAFVDYGSSGAGTVVFIGARGSVSASASASARASASAHVFARVQAHQGMMRSHGSYGHGW
ncbi:MAG TPA: hypothetical protein VN806_14590 [Caulobacteraceae bacterium]|nr:hypothetical protein [Caulobacteraceae bacterium]